MTVTLTVTNQISIRFLKIFLPAELEIESKGKTFLITPSTITSF